MNTEIQRLKSEKEALEVDLESQKGVASRLEDDKVQMEMRMAELEEAKEASEHSRRELEADIERLNVKLEYQKQPTIAFEKENELLQAQVRILRNCFDSIQRLSSYFQCKLSVTVSHTKTICIF